jgi:hypothetical protein
MATEVDTLERDRFDDPDEILRDIMDLHLIERSQSQRRHYATLIERYCSLTGTDLAEMGRVLADRGTLAAIG